MSDKTFSYPTLLKYQLADLVCSLPDRGRQYMAIDVHGSGNAFMTQTLLGYLHVNTLQKHDGRTDLSCLIPELQEK